MKAAIVNILIFTVAFCISCGSGTRSGVTGDGLVTIDVAADYPKEEIVLQDIADVEYVPLAISKEVLLRPGDRVLHLSDQFIIVVQSNESNVVIFNRQGEILTHFNRQGRGPNEYQWMGDIAFDEKAEEFFVFNRRGNIIVYSIEGRHKRTLTLPGVKNIQMLDFDEHSLLVYDNSNLESEGEYSTVPYYLISKTDGSVSEVLDIEMPVRYPASATQYTTDVDGTVHAGFVAIAFPNNRLGYGNDLTLADISSDTVWHYTRNRILTPAFVRTPSVHAAGPRRIWTTELVTDDFIVFTIVPLSFEPGYNAASPSLKYDYRTGRVSDVTFIDENYPSRSWRVHPLEANRPSGSAVSMLDPLRLTEAHEKGELSGPLAEIAATIKEDDNPVVMIVTFK